LLLLFSKKKDHFFGMPSDDLWILIASLLKDVDLREFATVCKQFRRVSRRASGAASAFCMIVDKWCHWRRIGLGILLPLEFSSMRVVSHDFIGQKSDEHCREIQVAFPEHRMPEVINLRTITKIQFQCTKNADDGASIVFRHMSKFFKDMVNVSKLHIEGELDTCVGSTIVGRCSGSMFDISMFPSRISWDKIHIDLTFLNSSERPINTILLLPPTECVQVLDLRICHSPWFRLFKLPTTLNIKQLNIGKDSLLVARNVSVQTLNIESPAPGLDVTLTHVAFLKSVDFSCEYLLATQLCGLTIIDCHLTDRKQTFSNLSPTLEQLTIHDRSIYDILENIGPVPRLRLLDLAEHSYNHECHEPECLLVTVDHPIDTFKKFKNLTNLSLVSCQNFHISDALYSLPLVSLFLQREFTDCPWAQLESFVFDDITEARLQWLQTMTSFRLVQEEYIGGVISVPAAFIQLRARVYRFHSDVTLVSMIKMDDLDPINDDVRVLFERVVICERYIAPDAPPGTPKMDFFARFEQRLIEADPDVAKDLTLVENSIDDDESSDDESADGEFFNENPRKKRRIK
jgi:hypothetical protein